MFVQSKYFKLPTKPVIAGATFICFLFGVLFATGQNTCVKPHNKLTSLERIEPTDPFDRVLYRYRCEHVTGEGLVNHKEDTEIRRLTDKLDETVKNRLDKLTADPEDRIWPDIPLGRDHPEAEEPWRNIQWSYENFIALAEAYVMPNSEYKMDPRLIEEISHGLSFLSNYYYADQRTYGNWWQWEIGIPQAILATLLLVADDLPEDIVNHHLKALEYHVGEPNIGKGSGDLAQIANLWVKRGLIERDSDIIKTGRDALVETLEYSPRNNIMPDGSAIDHGVYPYNLHYQGHFLREITEITQLLRDSPWALTKPDFPGGIEILYKWAYEAYEPLMWRGQAMSMVLGRHQLFETEANHGQWIVESFLRLGDKAPDPDGPQFKRIAKGWLQRNTYQPYLEKPTSIAKYATVKNLVANDTIPPRDPLHRYKQYYNMDRAVYHQSNFALGLAMFSQRIGNYSVLGDGRGPHRGWFTSYGMTYLYTEDLAHYNDAYWHTIDPTCIPGTTVNPAETEKISAGRSGKSSHAGGVELDDQAGSSSMELISVVDPDLLTAKKSWFCLEDSIIALGSDIRGNGGDEQIRTTVMNRNLGDEDQGTLIINGEKALSKAPAEEKHNNVSWAHLEREQESLGYVFPTRPDIRVIRETNDSKEPQTGTRDVHRFSDATYTRHYAKLLLEHGSEARNERYAYVILPETDAKTTAAYAADPPINILEHSPAAHAIEHTELSITAVQAFEATTIENKNIKVNAPVSVMYRETDETIEVAIADPTQQNLHIKIEFPFAVDETKELDDQILVTSTAPLTLIASVEQLEENQRGKTIKAVFSK